jgi:copper chaperone CopZ
MQTKTVYVPDIGCGNCVQTIQNQVSELEGVQSVKADEQTKIVTVQWNDKVNWEAIKNLLTEIGYPPAENEQTSA